MFRQFFDVRRFVVEHSAANSRGNLEGPDLETQNTLRKSIGTGANTSPQAVMRRLWPYIRPLILIIVLAIVAMGVVAATEAGIPAMLKPLLDHGFGAHSSERAKWFVPAAIIGLALVRGVAQYASNYLLNYVSNRILLKLRLEMFERMIHTSASFFQRETASTVINAVVFEVNQILSVLTGVMITLVRDSMTVIFLLGYLFYLNWQLTLIVAVILPGIGWLVSKINRRLRRLNREHQTLTNELSYIVEETVAGYKVVKTHNGERYEMDRFTAMSKRLRGYAMRMTISGGLAQPITQFLSSIALAIVITIAVVQSANDQTTVGGFVAFVTSMLLVISPLKHLIDVNQPLQRGMTAAELIFGLIDEPLEPKGGGRPLAQARGEIEYRAVSFDYGASERPTLDRISFKVAPGEMVALAGPSGGGKSTLVNLLPRFFDATDGAILVDGVPIVDYDVHALRSQLAMVSQDVVLFNDSIAANVAYGGTPNRERGRQPGRDGGGDARGHGHADRRQRHAPVGRPAPAPGDRARDLQGRADPDPRRGHLGARFGIRTARAGRAGAADGRAHHARHRAPAVDHRARRPDPGARGGPHRRGRQPRRAAAPQRALRAPASHPVPAAGRLSELRLPGRPVTPRHPSPC